MSRPPVDRSASWKGLIIAAVLTLATAPFVIGLRFDARPFAALGGNDEAFATLSQVLGEHEMLVVMLEAEEPGTRVIEAAREVDAALKKEPLLESVVGRLSPDDAGMLIDAAYVLWPERGLHRLERALTPEALQRRVAELQATLSLPGGRAMIDRARVDPLNLGPDLTQSIGGGAEAIDGSSGFLVSGRLVSFFARPKAPSKDGAATRDLFTHMTALRDEIAAKYSGVHLRMTGPHVYAAEYEQRLASGLGKSGALSLLLVIAMCVVLLGDIGFMAIAGATLALAAVWTMGVARLALGELQILAVSAASILPAIGIDAAVQFHAAFSQETGDVSARVSGALAQMRRPILVAAGASFAGFCAFLVADVAAFRQFGALLAIGVVANTVAMFTVLPGACLLLARVRPKWLNRTARYGLVEKWGERLYEHSRVTRFLPLGLAALVLLLQPTIERRFGFQALIEPTMEGALGQRAFERAFSASERHLFVLIEAKTRDEAIEAERAFSARLADDDELPIGRDRMAMLAVTKADLARARALAERRPPQAVAADWKKALDEAGFAEDVVSTLTERVEAMGEVVKTGEPKLPPLARFFADQRLVVHEERAVTFVSLFLMPKADVEKTVARLRDMAGSVKNAKLTVTGPALVDVKLQSALERDGVKLTALALFGALLALVIARMPWQRVLIAASALGLIFSGLYGLLAWLELPLTLVTLLVFPFVLGVGIDATVYLLDHPDYMKNGRKLLRHHLRPLLASTLTTLSGFLALMVVPLTDIRRLGISVALGLALALLVALTWVIAFARKPA